MSLIAHAKRELELAGFFDKDADYNGMIGEAVLELIKVFSDQGHSGCSAGLVSSLFEKLSKYKTITPLTFKDDEWNEVGNGVYQNNRNPCVFKESPDGRPYHLDAYVKKTPNGHCWSGRLSLKDGRKISRCYIKDPSNMPTITIDVLEKEVSKDDWLMWVEDEAQLDELAKYYDFDLVSVESV